MAKAQGLSLNTMVVAAIALIILIVLVGIFSGYFGDFVPGLKAAGQRTCAAPYETFPGECPSDYNRIYGNFAEGSVKEGDVCCKMKVVDAVVNVDPDEACLTARGTCTSGPNCRNSGGSPSTRFTCTGDDVVCCIANQPGN